MEKSIGDPWWAVVEAEAGESLWQPLPSRGHVTLKLHSENTPYDTFTSGTQVLPPGCCVREHGHQANHELIFIHSGSGDVEIEGNLYHVTTGSTVMFGRNARHIITNTGDVDMTMFWVFMPPGLEHWFRGIGRPRHTGESMPDSFSRPDGVETLMEQMRFVPPKTT